MKLQINITNNHLKELKKLAKELGISDKKIKDVFACDIKTLIRLNPRKSIGDFRAILYELLEPAYDS